MLQSSISEFERLGVIELGYRSKLLGSHLSYWLDHFRWIAALLVAIAHLRNAILPDAGNLSILEIPFYFVTLFGTQSVVIFFVMSGMLVGGVVLREIEGPSFRAGRYGIDRACRLYVALLPAVVLSVVLQWTVGAHDCPAPDSSAKILGNLLFLQNFSVEPLCNNHPMWSLSSEAYFYLVGPVFVLGIMRRSWKACLLGLIMLIPAIIFFKASYDNPLFGLVLWCVGLLPWFIKVRVPAWIATVPFFGVLLLSRVHFFPFKVVEDACIAITFTFLLCSCLDSVRAPLPSLAKRLSAFSYSLYLVHMPVAQALAYRIGFQTLPNREFSSYLVYSFALMFIIVLAWIFGWMFEDRTRTLRQLVIGSFQRIDTSRSRRGQDDSVDRPMI